MAEDNQMNAYLYGSISILVVSLMSLVGAVIIPCLKTNSRHRWMQVFIALAIATLACDALMHLIPQALGIHNHEYGTEDAHSGEEAAEQQLFGIDDHQDHDHDHDHGRRRKREEAHDHDDSQDKIRLLRMCVVIGAVYIFYIFETVAHGFAESRKRAKLRPKVSPAAIYTAPIPVWERKGSAGLESLNYPDLEPSNLGKASGSSYINGGVPTHLASQWTAQHLSEHPSKASLDTVMYATPSTTSSRELVPPTPSSTVSQLDQDPPVCLGFRPIAFMILMGDAVHNFADGLAVGAAFAHSNTAGLATSIAICAHELPHEIGDFAILIDSGLPICKALLLNLVSSVTAFAGLYVGIALGQGQEARMWIFALAAGMFLYVALVDMLPHLKHSDSTDPLYVQLALQNLGFILGFVLMFLIGWFEHDIKV